MARTVARVASICTAIGLAWVVNDHLGGSYQRMSWEDTAGSATSPLTIPLTSAITGATLSSAAWCQGGNHT